MPFLSLPPYKFALPPCCYYWLGIYTYSVAMSSNVFIRGFQKICGKAIPLQSWTGPEGSRRLRLTDFKTVYVWMWEGCQPYAPAAFTAQEKFLVLISVRGWVKTRDLVRPERLCQRKIAVRPSWIEPATFLLVGQYLNQLRHRVPENLRYVFQFRNQSRQNGSFKPLLGTTNVIWNI